MKYGLESPKKCAFGASSSLHPRIMHRLSHYRFRSEIGRQFDATFQVRRLEIHYLSLRNFRASAADATTWSGSRIMHRHVSHDLFRSQIVL